ncbi:MAG: dihydroxyacetone kinase subunit DhaL [Eubacteriales bacterium]|nr:dihydroxyacetone kinase subunit DhaL [Eubacteriales bacterium]
MIDKLEVGLFQDMFLSAAENIISQEPYLTEIDSAIGDGDHGLGMKRGFQSVEKLLRNKQYAYIDELCYEISVELIKTMGGASGIIFGSMFLGGVDCLPHSQYADAKQISQYFWMGEQSVEKRGKAQPGQKTMLDALSPACVQMELAAKGSADLIEVFRAGYQGALHGMEACRGMVSKTGRSRNFEEKTLGLPDPGAVSTTFIFEAFYHRIYENVR